MIAVNGPKTQKLKVKNKNINITEISEYQYKYLVIGVYTVSTLGNFIAKT